MKTLGEELTKYIKEKKTQEECVGFIAGWEAAIKAVEDESIKFRENLKAGVPEEVIKISK
jgi:hypothetical protein